MTVKIGNDAPWVMVCVIRYIGRSDSPSGWANSWLPYYMDVKGEEVVEGRIYFGGAVMQRIIRYCGRQYPAISRRADGTVKGRSCQSDNLPKKTRWCPKCKKKRVLWVVERHFFVCGLCDAKFTMKQLEVSA